MIGRRRLPDWDPTDDLPVIWLDANVTGTGSLKDTGGASISNGETVGHWISQGSSAVDFVQFGAMNRPTFESAGFNGGPCVRFNTNQVLAALAAALPASFSSMSGLTMLVAGEMVDDVFDGSFDNGTFAAVMVPHESGDSIGSLAWLCSASIFQAGGRRLQANSFQGATGSAIANGQHVIEAGVWDWANAKLSLYTPQLEVREQAFQTAGTTSATKPFSIGLGALPQEPGSIAYVYGNNRIAEVLLYTEALTADEMALRLHYLRRRYEIS